MTELEQSGGIADLTRRGFLKGILGTGAASAVTAYEVFAIQPDPSTPGQDPWELGPDAALTSASGGQVDVLGCVRVGSTTVECDVQLPITAPSPDASTAPGGV